MFKEWLESWNGFNNTSWMAVVTTTDCPKSVRNRCVIEVFGIVLALWLCFLDLSMGESFFVIALSQIASFFSW